MRIKPSRRDYINIALASNTDQCIEWIFAVRKTSGYGAHDDRGKNYDAHRYVCIQAHGVPCDDTLQAAHTCGNKLCINPKHLYWATPKRNMADAVTAKSMRGGGYYRQKIFNTDMPYIMSSGESVLALAKEFGVSPSTISRACRTYAARGFINDNPRNSAQVEA